MVGIGLWISLVGVRSSSMGSRHAHMAGPLRPVVAIFAVYFGYKHLVVGTAQTEAGPKPPVVDDMPNEDKAATTANTTLTETGERHAKSSADHEKAMDELIRRMKSDA